MPARRSTAVLVASSAAALLPLVAAAQKAAAAEDLLKAGGQYLATFAQQLGAAGADEEYTQYDVALEARATYTNFRRIAVDQSKLR